jgi:uncharacterized protein (DUF1499 family)
VQGSATVSRGEWGDQVRQALWAFGFIGLLAVGGLALAIIRGDESFGIGRLWERIAGPADLGPIDFASIRRSASGNDALFCPAGLCGSAPVDGIAPVFAAPIRQLRQAVQLIQVNSPDVEPVFRQPDGLDERYVARTALMRFPDTINVRYIDLGNGRSTIALHSRSQIGRKDFGVNKARLESWIKLLGETLPVARD